jgi:hypothetical protein
LQLYYKPRLFWNGVVDWNATTVKGLDGYEYGLLGCALADAIAAALAAGLGEVGLAELAGLALVLLVGTVWAAVPPIVVIPSYSTMSDTVVMLDLAVIGWVLLGLAAAAQTIAARGFYQRRLLPL